MRCNISVTYQFGDQFGQLLFNCVSSGFPNAAGYATWQVYSSRLLFWCALLALVSSCVGVMRHDCHEDAYCRVRAAFVRCSFQLFVQESATLLHRCSIVARSWSFDHI